MGAVLRIARRDACRARGRSLLVVAMIALPVLGVTAVDVVARTYELSPDQRAPREFGQADAFFRDTGLMELEQDGSGFGYSSPGVSRPPGTSVDVASFLPFGSRSLLDVSQDGLVTAGKASVRAQQRTLAYADPLAEGIYLPSTGRAPAGPGEVAVTTALAERLDLTLGDILTLDRESAVRTVVDMVEDGSRRDAMTVLLAPGAISAEAGSGESSNESVTQLLVDVPGEPDWSQVQAANAQGIYIQPRTPVPGAPPEPENSGGGETETFAAIALVVGMALLEVILLAGPAFGPAGAVVRTASMPTMQQQDRARAAIQALGVQGGDVYVERGYVSNYGVGLLALAAGSALLVLGASGIATGLAAADGRSDLSTLASVGATPGMRRRLAGAQSLVTAGLGTALGIVAGLVPAVGLIRAINAPVDGFRRTPPFPLVIPWETLAVTVFVVPLLAVLAAVLLTRSRLPLVRRLA